MCPSRAAPSPFPGDISQVELQQAQSPRGCFLQVCVCLSLPAAGPARSCSIPPCTGSHRRGHSRSHTGAFVPLPAQTVLTHFPSFPLLPPPAVGVFSLLHLPQPSEGGMLCKRSPGEGKLSHSRAGWGTREGSE